MTQTLALDHIVIAVEDRDTAIADYRALGFQVLVGGEHPGRTSHNALIVFKDGSYLEIIAWRAPAPDERWYRTLRDHGEGLVDFALLPHDTAQALAEARERGLQTLTGPLDGSRLRPDGQQLAWQTARHATPDLPFLCGDITPRALRVPEGDVRVHPNGALGVATLSVAVHDLDATLVRYRALLGPAAPTDAFQISSADGIRTATFKVGSLQLMLESVPTDSAAAATAHTTELVRPTTRAASLQQRLTTRGEGPSALSLHRLQSHQPTVFNESHCHGVALRWEL